MKSRGQVRIKGRGRLKDTEQASPSEQSEPRTERRPEQTSAPLFSKTKSNFTLEIKVFRITKYFELIGFTKFYNFKLHNTGDSR